MGAYLRPIEAQVRRDLPRSMTCSQCWVNDAGRRPARSPAVEQQMCAIGRGVMSRPQLLMIDELSLGLAPRAVEGSARRWCAFNRNGN